MNRVAEFEPGTAQGERAHRGREPHS
jgi:hypothetical protein